MRALIAAAPLALSGCATGGSRLSPAAPPGGDAAAAGAALTQADPVSAVGTYQTSFAIAVPPAQAEPKVALVYDSGAGGSLAGVGFDLTVGWPMSISRDVRFGTPRWTLDADWLWGSTPLVRMNPKEPECAGSGWCRYRLAPEALTEVAIDLTTELQETPGPARAPSATVRLPTGTTLDYEPIVYDGVSRPPSPAGAQTNVFGFRLASATDRNGYRVCFRYAPPPADNTRGEVEPLVEIGYGPAAPYTATCAALFANASRHRVMFEYTRLRQAGYFASWTARFGAPASFNHLLTRIAVIANGSQLQDVYLLTHAGASSTETRRPLLASIAHRVPLPDGAAQQPPATATKVVRTFGYGRRSSSYGGAEVIDIGAIGSFPPALAGSVSRPIRRASLLDNPNGLFQAGQDQDSDAAPPSHATSEEWSFMDFNGDGLPDFQWAKESGADPARQWPTFEQAPPVVGSGVDRATRPAQQRIVLNDGISNGRLATSSPTWISSSAPSLEVDYAWAPSPRNAFPTKPFTEWFWGEGRGQTRTGMPVSIHAGEIANQMGTCPRQRDQDPRHWPLYPDGTWGASKGSLGASLAQLDVRGLEDTLNAGNPALTIIKGIHDGYRPNRGVSATVSGWTDMTGDGIPEFVATPGWIERFSINPGCVTWTDPGHLYLRMLLHTLDAEFANETSPATDPAGKLDTRWHYNGSLALPSDASTQSLFLTPRGGPPGPVGLPLSYETTTSTSEGRGFTLPVGSLVSTGISSILTPGWKWIPIAAAAPGLTIDSATPRTAGGFRLSIPAPSATGVLQGLGSTAYGMASSGVDAGSIAGFIMSVLRVNLDLTLLSTTSRSRSENRAQLMDVNADGLPDSLLYASGCIPLGPGADGTPLFTEGCIPTGTRADGSTIFAPSGSLLAYLNTPHGFAQQAPVVLNTGFSYAAPPPSLPLLDVRVEVIKGLANQLTSPLLGFPNERCLASALACPDYIGFLYGIVDKASEILNDPDTAAFMAATRDLTPAERSQWNELRTLRDTVEGEAITLTAQAALLVPPVLAQIATATVTAQTLSETAGQFALSIRHVGYPSRINVPSQGFAMLGGQEPTDTDEGPDDFQPVWEHADGVAAQTRGFVDLNGDGLPDYVNTDDRESPCGPNQWQVFWGTGTSSASAGLGFLREPDATGRARPDCIDVPVAPAVDVAGNGYHTLPMNLDRVRRAATALANDVSSRVNSFVSLNDVNRDGRPDILIAGDTWDPDATSQTWHVFLNTGSGFETTSSLDIASPQGRSLDLEIADCRNPDFTRSCIDAPLHVPYPALRTTRAIGNPGMSRDISQTEAGILDIDGDGNPEVVRRIHIIEPDTSRAPTDRPKREGLLVWRRAEVGGPQDLMIEERFPVEGRRNLVEYRSATSFQWDEARPDGQAPRLGHRPVAGLPGRLVRSVTTERMIGRDERCTRLGYDYKLPYFDMAARNPAGFALRSTFALEPCPVAAADAVAIPASLVQTQRNAQRPDLLPGLTQTRSTVQSTGAPASELLTSYAESEPVTRCPGVGSSPNPDGTAECPLIGGLRSVFAAPTRLLGVEYPGNLARGAIFDVGFDGREPLVDRATGRGPAASGLAVFPSQAATGGSMLLAPGAGAVTYASPHPASPAPPNPAIAQATVEAWLKAAEVQGEEVVVEQVGAYRLSVVNVNGAGRWRLQVDGTPGVTSAGTGDLVAGRWHHVAASFGPEAGRIFVDGRLVGETPWTLQGGPVPAGPLLVACGSAAAGAAPACFRGEIGELRVYPEAWTVAPRVTDKETEFRLPAGCRFDPETPATACPSDFGQPVRVLSRNDLATGDDDVVTKLSYAVPVPRTIQGRQAAPVYGQVSTESTLAPATASGSFLAYGERAYDGLPVGSIGNGNLTLVSRYDGEETTTQPTANQLRVRTSTEFGDPFCPGQATRTTDPLGFSATMSWDPTCTFVTRSANALGHETRNSYYGVDFPSSPFDRVRTGPYGKFVLWGRYGQAAETVDPNGATTLRTYDEWRRPVAVWSALDRSDRPGLRTEYEDALCEKPGFPFVVDPLPEPVACSEMGITLWLRSPARATSRAWDDQLRRCADAAGKTVQCSSPSAAAFLAEEATGGYRTSHAFADGQAQAQAVQDGKPGWTLSGVADTDRLGRLSGSYKVRYLPKLDALGEGPCQRPGVWCDSGRAHGSPGGVDQLRTGVAAIQLAYDARSRVVRTYGPGWPRCPGDPSALDAAGQPSCDAAIAPAQRGDVIRFDYPAPGDVRTTDANGVPTLTHQDARGLPTLFQEYVLSSSGAPTAYSGLRSTYDRLGRLATTTDQAGNVGRNEYDAMSRRTVADDPDLGRTTYAYDLRSALTEEVSATGDKTVHEYDPIGRIAQTDYLTPRTVTEPGLASCCEPPGGEVVKWSPPDLCYEVPGLSEPTPVGPAPPGPTPPYSLEPLPLTGDLGQGVAELPLPFDVTIRANGPSAGGDGAGAAPGFEGRDFRFPQGTTLTVGTGGTISLGAPKGGSGGTLFVFGTELALREGGLRYGVGGPDGGRTLTVEWEGTLASRPGDEVLVRAVLSEGGGVVRYEFDRVPRDASALVGVRLGPEGAFGRTGPPGEGTPSWPPVASGTAVAFGEPLPAKSFRLNCGVGRARVVIPVEATGVENATLQVRYRVFSDCGAAVPGEGCTPGDGELRIGYGDEADREAFHELGRARFSPRPRDRSGDGEIADVLDVPWPAAQGGKLGLILDYSIPGGGGRNLLDVVSVVVQRTTYVPEERVYRTYDSSEPPDFVESRANGSLFESKPVLDLTFDVPQPLPPAAAPDRSPTRATLACTRTPLESTAGVSGRGVVIPGGASCQAQVPAAPVTRFAAEMWVHPRVQPQQPQAILSGGTAFTVTLLPTGRVECGLGGAAGSVVGDLALSTEQAAASASGAWAHVAVSYDDAARELRCAVNGVSKAMAGPGGWARSLSPVRIGDDARVGVDVEVDEVRILPAARSPQEILEDALRPLASGPPRGNLVHLDFAQPGDPGADVSKAGSRALFTGAGSATTPGLGRLAVGIQGIALDTGPGEQLTIPDPPNSTLLRLADELTPEIWLKRRQTAPGAPGGMRLLGKWEDEQHPGWRLDLEPGSGRIRWEVVTRFTDSAGLVSLRNQVFVTYETLSVGGWHHVAATYDGARLRVFIDGQPAHRWCWTGPQEGSTPEGTACTEPPPPQPCAIETRVVEVASLKPGEPRNRSLGDAACISGTVDNGEPILVASDKVGPSFDGLIDEVRLSNYAKREFEVAASARLASAYTRSLGRQTQVRNRLPVEPASNDLPFDLADLVSRELTQFDLAGRAVSWRRFVRGQKSPVDYFRMRAAPDAAARSGLLEYPHGEVLVAGYALDGTPASLVGYGPNIGPAPDQRQVYVAAAASTVTGRAASLDFGNGVRSTWTYEDGPVSPGSPGAPGGAFGPDSLKTAKVSSGPRLLSDRTYDWDLVGSLRYVRDAAAGPGGAFEASYGYDDLRRIRSATLTLPGQAAASWAYGYDAVGNLTSKEGVTQEYGVANAPASCRGASPLAHALTRRIVAGGADPYCYDAAGRLLRSVDTPGNSIRTYGYYARGKPSRLTDRNGTSRYSYDGNGLRVAKVETDGRAQVVPSPSFREISVPSSSTSFEATYSAAGRIMARRELPSSGLPPPATQPLWFSNDHLGGTYFLTDASGAEVAGSRAFYRPFGEFAGSAPTLGLSGRRQFTSKELDSSGLYDYGARPYDPATGRFTQADEVEPGRSAQSRNRYSYVLNNPLIHVDPTGTTCQKAAGGWICRFDSIVPRAGTGKLTPDDWRMVRQFEDSYTKAFNQLMSHPDRTVSMTLHKGNERGDLVMRFDESGGLTLETATARVKAGDLARELASRRFVADYGVFTPVGDVDNPAWAATFTLPDAGVETRLGRLGMTTTADDMTVLSGHEALHRSRLFDISEVDAPTGLPPFSEWHSGPYDDAVRALLAPGPDDKGAAAARGTRAKPAAAPPPVEKDLPDHWSPGVRPR